MVQFAGTTMAYQLYRIGEWLWNLEIRDTFDKIVEFVANLPHSLEEEKNIRSKMNLIFGRDIDDEEFKSCLRKLRDLERIKHADSEVLLQLHSFGRIIVNFGTTEGFIFVAHRRLWHHANESVMATNFVIAMPSIARVAAYETSEDIESFKQFAKIRIKNSQFYSIFNKLKAVRGRNTQETTEIATIDQLVFLFRTISDIKIIHKSPKIPSFTFTPTTGEEAKKFQVANYFIILGKISEFLRTTVSGKKIARIISDFGNIDMFVDDREIINSHRSPLLNNTLEYFNASTAENKEVTLSFKGHALIFGFWGMDEPSPWIIHMIPFHGSLSQEKIDAFNLMSYMNVRKKVHTSTLKKLFVKINSTDKILMQEEWTYMLKRNWDMDVFQQIIKLPRGEIIGPMKKLLHIDEMFVPLYISEQPEKEFARFYHLPAQLICPKCGGEVFRMNERTLIDHIIQNDGEFYSEYMSLYSHNKGIMEVLSSLNQELGKITTSRNSDSARDFVRKFVNVKLPLFENMDSLRACEVLHSVFSHMTSIENRKMSFKFPHERELLKTYLSLETPRKIHIGNENPIEISLGNNCIIHGSTEPVGDIQSVLSRILENYAKEQFERNQNEILGIIVNKMKNMCIAWNNIVSSSIALETKITTEDIESVTSQWEKISSELNRYKFSNFDGTGIDLSPITELSVKDMMFFLFCYLVSKKNFLIKKDLEEACKKISEFKNMFASRTAMHTSNINDMDLLLRIVAYRFIDFVYKEAFGTKQPFDANVLSDSLQMQIDRCTFISDKKNSNRFINLKSLSIKSRIFDELCRQILIGDISGLDDAENFLARNTKLFLKKQRTSEKKHIIKQKQEESRRLMHEPRTSRVEYADNRISNRSMEELTRLALEERFKNRGLTRSTEEIIWEWNRAMEAKSKTHAPQIYEELRKSLQPKIQHFMGYFSKTCPELSSLRGKTMESKEIKLFFRMILQTNDFSKDNISRIMKGIE